MTTSIIFLNFVEAMQPLPVGSLIQQLKFLPLGYTYLKYVCKTHQTFKSLTYRKDDESLQYANNKSCTKTSLYTYEPKMKHSEPKVNHRVVLIY